MTVCVVAISNGVIFGASDRMITSGDIEFEPQQSKIYLITNSIIAQIAGDATIQAEILQRVAMDVQRYIEANPKELWTIRGVAELYRHYYEELRLTHTEHNILVPLGLDQNTWLTKQKEMDTELVKNIASELINYDFPKTAIIFSGIDKSGAHIYVVRDGNISCQDSVGFAAIGVGEWHASSHLMFARHSRYKSIPETLLLVYYAKKRAEVAPGVGIGADMFAIGPALGSYAPLTQDNIETLEKIYQKEQIRQLEAKQNANSEVIKYVKELAERIAIETKTKKGTDDMAEPPINTKTV